MARAAIKVSPFEQKRHFWITSSIGINEDNLFKLHLLGTLLIARKLQGSLQDQSTLCFSSPFSPVPPSITRLISPMSYETWVSHLLPQQNPDNSITGRYRHSDPKGNNHVVDRFFNN
jgi:hypothetical protein